MAYALAPAAAAVGRHRSAVLRAIKAGKVSAVRDEATAEWRIEPAELHRLYPVADAQRDPQSRIEGAQVEMLELRPPGRQGRRDWGLASTARPGARRNFIDRSAGRAAPVVVAVAMGVTTKRNDPESYVRQLAAR